VTETNWGKITVYRPSMAAQAAEMFNAFNEIWPGGFRGGIPYDEQHVKDWLDNTSAIADLIALDPEGNPVGYCGLYPHYRDAHAAYISILGVHPKVLGKKFGKRLLLKVLEIAAEKGIQRMDLNTWSGNLKAMPLYKKVGLFWVPDTSVYMQDYLPGLFQIPLAKEWFSMHPDWYTTFKRELHQAPDTYTVDGMEVYTYTFEAGDDRLSAHVDRYGWGFSSIESVLEGKKIAVKTRLRSHKIFIGVPNALTIEIVNETGEEVPVTLLVEPFKGLELVEPFPRSFLVKNGEKIEITREFVVNSDVTVFESYNRASEVIKSVITIKDQSIELYTGGKIRPAVTITSQGMYKIAPSGKVTTVYLDVINNTKKELTGKIDVYIEEIPDRTLIVHLSPQEVSGIEIPVPVPAHPSLVTLRATPTIEVDKTTFVMPSYNYTVVSEGKDMAVIVKGTDEKKLVMLTDFCAVHIDCEGGKIRILPRGSSADIGGERIDFDVGPPFGLSLDRTLQFDYEFVQKGTYFTVVLTGRSMHVPGVEIKKYIAVAPGMHEVEFWVTLTNVSDGPLHVAGKVSIGGGEGIHIDPFSVKKRVFTPLRGTVIESDPTTNVMSENMVPQSPAYWEESWTAAQHMNRSDFSGWIWKPDTIEKITVSAGSLRILESETHVLNPGESYEPTRVWYTFSHASLQEVRNRWNQLVGNKEIPPPESYNLKTTPPVAVTLDAHTVEKGKKTRKTVEIHFATVYPFPGKLQLNLPPGWEGYFVTKEGITEEIAMPESTPGEPALINVELSAPDVAEPSALVNLHFSGEFELDFDIPLLVLGKKEVQIREKDIDEHSVLEVSNGMLTFTVVTEVGGNLIRLKDSQERSFLADNYPEIKPKFFTSYNIGGIQPLIFTPDQDDPFFEPEKTHAHRVEESPWRGIKVAWTVQNQELLRGQNFSLTYLTVPDSEVIRIRLEHENPTNRLVKWVALLVADVELQGSMDDTILTAPGGTQTWIRNRVTKPFMSLASLENPWIRASKGDQSITIFAPESSSGTIMGLDLGEMMMGLMIAQAETGPYGKTAVEFAFAVNQPQGKVKELRKALAHQ